MTDPPEADLAKAHAILRKALRAVAPEHRPPPPWHAGGPLLTCPAIDQIGISLWCSELLADRAAASEKKEIARLRKMVRAFLDAPAMIPVKEWAKHAHGGKMKGREADLYRALEAAGEIGKADSAALACLRRAASGAATYCRSKPDLVFSSATAAVSRVVKELASDPRPMTVRAFLEELDGRLMRSELAGACRARTKKEPPPLGAVLFRSADDDGRVAYWIARLASGGYVSLGRAGAGARATWSWVEGSRDDVLASVPDALFAEATRRVVG